MAVIIIIRGTESGARHTYFAKHDGELTTTYAWERIHEFLDGNVGYVLEGDPSNINVVRPGDGKRAHIELENFSAGNTRIVAKQTPTSRDASMTRTINECIKSLKRRFP